MAGKYGPNENSWITWERFITVRVSFAFALFATTSSLTSVVRMLPGPITMSKGGDVKIGRHFSHLNAAIHPACWTFVHPIMRRTEVGVTCRSCPEEESSETGQRFALIRSRAARFRDHFRRSDGLCGAFEPAQCQRYPLMGA